MQDVLKRTPRTTIASRRDQSGRRSVLWAEVRISVLRDADRPATWHAARRRSTKTCGALPGVLPSRPTARRCRRCDPKPRDMRPRIVPRRGAGALRGHLPCGLSPVQAVIATITSDADDVAREVTNSHCSWPRAESDLRTREDQLYNVREPRIPRSRCCSSSARRSGRTHSVVSAGSGKEGQQ